MSKLYLGLDIGAATVGYGLINIESDSILEAGTRLFPMADAANNIQRRNMRGARRLSRRKKHRIKRTKGLLKRYGFDVDSLNINLNPYEIRVKGLREKLTDEEFAIALLSLVKNRGISYIEDMEEIDDDKNGNSILAKKLDESADKYVCEIQLERLNECHELIKSGRVLNDACLVTVRNQYNVFRISQYKKELNKLFKTQSPFNERINDSFISEFMNIYESKREYFIGPGDENNRTDYGIYRTNGETWDNIFDILVGKCTIFPNERRAPKASYTAQEFNFLNDLNNIKVDGEKLSKEQKNNILEQVFSSKTVNMLNIISKVTSVEKELITGYRINKENKPEFHTFDTFRYVRNKLWSDIGEINITKEEFNIIANEVSSDCDFGKKFDKLRSLLNRNKYSDKAIELIISSKKSNKFTGYHSLSYKAMDAIMNELYDEPKNQQQLFVEKGLMKEAIEKYKGLKSIPHKEIENEILSPIAKRSIIQSIKMINLIIEKYGELDGICIELARDMYDDADAIKKKQENNFKEKNEILKYVQNEGYRGDKLTERLKLWAMQDGMCLYSGKKIIIDDLIRYPEKFEVDHIIPKSVSFDDSLENKTLCFYDENQSKGQMTPYHYMKSKGKDYDSFKARVLDLHKRKFLYNNPYISKKKKDLLLFEEDITKFEVLKGFINRNLVDTRYASKVVFNMLQGYMKANGKKTKIYCVRGGFTSNLRHRWDIENKDRDLFKNHAEDALIIASVPKLGYIETNSLVKSAMVLNSESEVLENAKVEVIDDKDFNSKIYTPPISNFKYKINNFEYKFSHKVDSKPNREISDATIYGTKVIENKEYVIKKYKNIYGKEGESLKKRLEKNSDSILMKYEDKKTYNILLKILEEYPNSKNPFLDYFKEHGYIRKYSKNNNGPIVKSIKFKDGVNSKIDISHKYSTKNGSGVALLSIKPFRVDIYEKDGLYKMIDISYSMFNHSKDGYKLNMDKYNSKKFEKGITEDYVFKFSLRKNDVFAMNYKGEVGIWRYTSTYDANANKIEVKFIDKNSEKRKAITIGKTLLWINKLHVDVLGNIYSCKNEKLKLIF